MTNGIDREQGPKHLDVGSYATPLMAAVQGRSISAIRTLQKYCPDLDMDNRESFEIYPARRVRPVIENPLKHGHTAAVIYAARYGLKEIVELLCFEGASILTQDDNYLSARSFFQDNKDEFVRWVMAKEIEEDENRREVKSGRKKWGPDMSRPVEEVIEDDYLREEEYSDDEEPETEELEAMIKTLEDVVIRRHGLEEKRSKTAAR